MIGSCAWCGCTDTLLALVRPGGFVVKVCEFCAHESRTEHDDKGHEGGERESNDDSENGAA